MPRYEVSYLEKRSVIVIADSEADAKSIASEINDERKWDENPLGGDFDVEDVTEFSDDEDAVNAPSVH